MSDSAIIGVGNDFRADDAAGLVAARRLRQELLKFPEFYGEVSVFESSGEITELLELFTRFNSIYIIDAIDKNGITQLCPSRVWRINAHSQQLRDLRFRSSTHALGVVQAIELAKVVGTLPAKLEIFAIAATEFSFRKGISRSTAQGVQQVVEVLVLEVYRQLKMDDFLSRRQLKTA